MRDAYVIFAAGMLGMAGCALNRAAAKLFAAQARILTEAHLAEERRQDSHVAQHNAHNAPN